MPPGTPVSNYHQPSACGPDSSPSGHWRSNEVVTTTRSIVWLVAFASFASLSIRHRPTSNSRARPALGISGRRAVKPTGGLTPLVGSLPALTSRSPLGSRGVRVGNGAAPDPGG
jgi:hypothetical protein